MIVHSFNHEIVKKCWNVGVENQHQQIKSVVQVAKLNPLRRVSEIISRWRKVNELEVDGKYETRTESIW